MEWNETEGRLLVTISFGSWLRWLMTMDFQVMCSTVYIKKKKTVAVTEGHVGRTGVTKSKTASRRSLIRAFGCLWCFRLWVDYYRYYYPKLV